MGDIIRNCAGEYKESIPMKSTGKTKKIRQPRVPIDLNIQCDFIEEIQKATLLWDPKYKISYKKIRDKIWENVAKKQGVQASFIINQWKLLMKKYMNHFAGVKTMNPVLLEKMEFMHQIVEEIRKKKQQKKERRLFTEKQMTSPTNESKAEEKINVTETHQKIIKKPKTSTNIASASLDTENNSIYETKSTNSESEVKFNSNELENLESVTLKKDNVLSSRHMLIFEDGDTIIGMERSKDCKPLTSSKESINISNKLTDDDSSKNKIISKQPCSKNVPTKSQQVDNNEKTSESKSILINRYNSQDFRNSHKVKSEKQITFQNKPTCVDENSKDIVNKYNQKSNKQSESDTIKKIMQITKDVSFNLVDNKTNPKISSKDVIVPKNDIQNKTKSSLDNVTLNKNTKARTIVKNATKTNSDDKEVLCKNTSILLNNDSSIKSIVVNKNLPHKNITSKSNKLNTKLSINQECLSKFKLQTKPINKDDRNSKGAPLKDDLITKSDRQNDFKTIPDKRVLDNNRLIIKSEKQYLSNEKKLNNDTEIVPKNKEYSTKNISKSDENEINSIFKNKNIQYNNKKLLPTSSNCPNNKVISDKQDVLFINKVTCKNEKSNPKDVSSKKKDVSEDILFKINSANATKTILQKDSANDNKLDPKTVSQTINKEASSYASMSSINLCHSQTAEQSTSKNNSDSATITNDSNNRGQKRSRSSSEKKAKKQKIDDEHPRISSSILNHLLSVLVPLSILDDVTRALIKKELHMYCEQNPTLSQKIIEDVTKENPDRVMKGRRWKNWKMPFIVHAAIAKYIDAAISLTTKHFVEDNLNTKSQEQQQSEPK